MLVAEPGQCAASGFARTKGPSTFGHLPLSARFDPTCCDESLFTTPLFTALVPTDSEIRNAPELVIRGTKPSFISWGEEVEDGVMQFIIPSLFKSSPEFEGWRLHGRTTFETCGMALGFATSNSYPDIQISFRQNILVGIGEVKGQECGIPPAVLQASVAASHVALRLVALGLAASSFYVPVMSTTGLLMQFGATVVLSPSFPVYIPISKTFDMLDSDDARKASAFLIKAAHYAGQINDRLSAINTPASVLAQMAPVQIKLDIGASFFVKVYDVDTFSRGPGLFAESDVNITDIMPGWERMVQCFNALYAVPDLRSSIAFPLAMCMPDSVSANSSSTAPANPFKLVFRNLTMYGFRIGCPDRTVPAQRPLFDFFKAEVQRVVGLMHSQAHILHCDLYLSNIMWRCTKEGRVEIKLIDFDCNHRVNEGDFVPEARARLTDFFGSQVVFGVCHDLKYLSVLELDETAANRHHWQNLASNDKARIDSSFRSLLAETMSLAQQ